MKTSRNEKIMQVINPTTQSNTHIHGLFQPKENVSKLLQYVMEGNELKVSEFLKNNPELCFEKGTITDYSGRTFKNISALQYAAWGYDMQMLYIMTSHSKTTSHLDIIKEQLAHLETHGTEHGSHYDFAGLLANYENILNQKDISKEKIIENIGAQQKCMPLFIVNLFCVDNDIRNKYYQLPLHNNPHLPIRAMHFNYKKQIESWYPLNECSSRRNNYIIAREYLHNEFPKALGAKADLISAIKNNYNVLSRIQVFINNSYKSFSENPIKTHRPIKKVGFK